MDLLMFFPRYRRIAISQNRAADIAEIYLSSITYSSSNLFLKSKISRNSLSVASVFKYIFNLKIPTEASTIADKTSYS